MISRERRRYIGKIYTLNQRRILESFRKEIRIYELIKNDKILKENLI
jgi:hypothetical protein